MTLAVDPSSQVAAAILGASNVASNIYIYILYIIVAFLVSRFFISQAYYKSDSLKPCNHQALGGISSNMV